MHADISRPSAQPRAAHPETAGDPHPRCLELAERLRELAAIGNGVSFRDITGAGFTAAEVIEFGDEARRIADEASVRQVSPSPDRMADMIAKAKSPLPNRPLLPEGTHETQALFVGWGNYCAARSALLIDPWPGQRERCLDRLRDHLNRLPLLPRDRKAIVNAVATALQASERGGRDTARLEAAE